MSEASIIWLDEFDSLWIKKVDIQRLKRSGKTIYAISPEIHGFSLVEMELRWRQFFQWGINGICTDYPAKLVKVLAAEGVSQICK